MDPSGFSVAITYTPTTLRESLNVAALADAGGARGGAAQIHHSQAVMGSREMQGCWGQEIVTSEHAVNTGTLAHRC